MNNIWKTKIVQYPEAEPTGGGSSGGTPAAAPVAGSLLTPSAGGSKPAASSGGAGAAAAPGTNNAPAGNAPAGGGAAGQAPADWRSTLPPELQKDATLQKFADVPTLAQSYLNAQKLIGKDKIPLPDKHTTDEQWQEIYQKLGVPADVKDYAVKFKEGITIDPKFSEDFKTSAHKLGILPKQAQALADWFSDINLNSEKTLSEQNVAQSNQNIAALKTEWGNAFDSKVARINKVLDEHGGADLKKELEMRGLGANVPFMKMLAGLGDKLYKEDRVVDGAPAAQGMTPSEARQAAMAIISNKAHAYHDKAHPNHAAAVKEVSDLFAAASPQVQ